VKAFWLPVKRFRCRSCQRTWSFQPPVVVRYKRYAARIIDGCWETWSNGLSLEATAERWQLRCVRTVQRWLGPIAAAPKALMGEVRRLLGTGKEPQQTSEEPPQQKVRTAVKALRTLTQALLQEVPARSSDSTRVPYHFVMRASLALQC
jgi:hypothetical protein